MLKLNLNLIILTNLSLNKLLNYNLYIKILNLKEVASTKIPFFLRVKLLQRSFKLNRNHFGGANFILKT